jgi:chemotaxis regulatin CheY-phosphate phosphatase CheZ
MGEAQSSDPLREASAKHADMNRLAEMVVHLTECTPERAIAAVEAARPVDPVAPEDALEIVARAIVKVRRVDLRDHVDLRDKTAQRTDRPVRS